MHTLIPWILVGLLTGSALAKPAAEPMAEPALDVGRLIEDVALLAGAGELVIRSRHVEHPDHEVAGDWLLAELQGIGRLTVWEQPFEAERGTGLRNLVADLPGSKPESGWLVVAAHWDSTAVSDESWDFTIDPAPGADDDASGVAAVLGIARWMAQSQWEHSVRFVLFDAEEQGLLGSQVHTAQLAADGESVAMMWALDPIGYNHDGGGRLWVTYDDRWEEPSRELEQLAPIAAPLLMVTALDGALLGGSSFSDHASFWEEGYPALHIASWPQPPTYHTMDDTIDGVDPDFLGDVTRLVAAHVGQVAVRVTPDPGPGLGPEPRGCGCGSGIWSAGWWPVYARVRAQAP